MKLGFVRVEDGQRVGLLLIVAFIQTVWIAEGWDYAMPFEDAQILDAPLGWEALYYLTTISTL